MPDDSRDLSPFPKERPEQFIGTVLSERYEILEILGKGGMGFVFKGRHLLVDRVVAIKVLRSNLLQDEVTRKRFQQEAKAAGGLTHPHLISVFDYGFAPEGDPYLVMDFLEGHSLDDAMKHSGGVISIERFARIMSQTCKALSYIHKRGVIHRDLKPSNIMLVPTDEDSDYVKLVDFGIAKVVASDQDTIQRLTVTGQSFGSPLYMSPEQCMGKEVDERSDIYSLGCVMFEMLTGTPPIIGENPLQTLYMHCNQKPMSFDEANKSVEIPADLQKILLKALEKDSKKRWESARALADEIEKLNLETRSQRTGKAPARPSKEQIKPQVAEDMRKTPPPLPVLDDVRKAPPPLPAQDDMRKTPPPLSVPDDMQKTPPPVEVDQRKTTPPPLPATVSQSDGATSETGSVHQTGDAKRTTINNVVLVGEDEIQKRRKATVVVSISVACILIASFVLWGPPNVYQNVYLHILREQYNRISARADDLFDEHHYFEAEKAYREVLPKAREILGSANKDVAYILYRLAVSMHNSGRGTPEEALTNLNEAQVTLKRLFDDPEGGASFYTDILFEQGNLEEERDSIEKALEKYEEILRLKSEEAKDSPKVAAARWRAGEMYSGLGRSSDAITNLQAAFDGYKAQQVRDYKSLASCGLSLAKSQAKLSKFAEARQSVREVETYLRGNKSAQSFDKQIAYLNKDIEEREASSKKYIATALNSYFSTETQNLSSSLSGGSTKALMASLPRARNSISNAGLNSFLSKDSVVPPSPLPPPTSTSTSTTAAAYPWNAPITSQTKVPWTTAPTSPDSTTAVKPKPWISTPKHDRRPLTSTAKIASTFDAFAGKPNIWSTSRVSGSSRSLSSNIVNGTIGSGTRAPQLGAHMKRDGTAGVAILQVRPGSPVTGQLAANDVIVSVDGVPVSDPMDVKDVIRKHNLGDSVVVSFKRGGVMKTTTIKF